MYVKENSPTLPVFFIFILSVISCRDNRSKKDHTSTTQICDKYLFVETFEIYGGNAYDGDIVSQFLTDSTNFRIYVGTFDNAHEGYSYQCSGDSIRISKLTYDSSGNKNILNINSYNIAELKKSKRFE